MIYTIKYLASLFMGSAVVQYAALGLILWGAWSSHIYFERRDAVKQAQQEAIKLDAAENREILDAANHDDLEHQNTVTKSQAKLEREEDEIKSLKPSQCLDVRLDAIGLQ